MPVKYASWAACRNTPKEVASSSAPVLLELVLPSARAGTLAVRLDLVIRVVGCTFLRARAAKLLGVMWQSPRVRAAVHRVAGSQSAAAIP